MIIGTAEFLKKFKTSRINTNPKQVKKVEDRAEWLSDQFFVLSENNDGEFEDQVRQELNEINEVNLLWLPAKIDPEIQSFRPVDRRPIQGKKSGSKTPKVKPPNMWGKVSSLWKAVSGPKVDQETFEHRLFQCTSKGGYTFCPYPCTVVSVSDRQIRVNTKLKHINALIYLPEGEIPSVVVDQELEEGQIISTGDEDKDCPHLRRDDKEDKIFCGACGCPKSKLGELHQKLWYANLKCPRKPPLFTDVTVEKSQEKFD